MPTMEELVAAIAGETEASMASVRDVLRSLTGQIVAAARKGEEVSLPGLGKFKVRETAARTGRNPQTGAPVKIAAGRRLTFTAAKAAKDALSSKAKKAAAPAKKAPAKSAAKKAPAKRR